MSSSASSAAPAPSLVPSRESLDPKYTWDLSSIFPSWEAWEAAFAELEGHPAVLVSKEAQILGVLTRSDLLQFLAARRTV